MRSAVWIVACSLGVLMGHPMAARGQAVYEYTGNPFDSITDEEPPAGTFDTMMRVSGSVTFALPLAPNLAATDVTADVIDYELDDGRQTIDPTIDTDFSFLVGTDANGDITTWALFAQVMQILDGSLVQTHEIVSRTTAGGFDRGLRFVEDESTQLGTDIGLVGGNGAWMMVPEPGSSSLLSAAFFALCGVGSRARARARARARRTRSA